MDKTSLKIFAREARKKLIIGVKQRAAYFKITASGIDELQVLEGIKIVNGQPINKKISQYYTELVNKIKLLAREMDYEQAYEEVMEEVAYTWFNRLITFRFMEVHDYLPIRMLLLSSSVQAKEEPDALTNVGVIIDDLKLEQELVWKLQDEHNQNELFKYLLVQQSHQLGELIPTAFEPIGGLEELLLPDNLLNTDSVIKDLVDKVGISNWEEVEVIGWLYQYYQSEVKEQVGGLKNYLVSKHNLATVTQLFTPKWIVRYMLQNSLAKLYKERYPANHLTDKMDYYLDRNQADSLLPNTFQNLEDIRVVDPACGSGNILIEAFDLLYEMYLEQGYSPREISQYIIGKNLYGFEIDKRSTQISHISLFLKAVEKNPRIIRHQQKFDFHIYEYLDVIEEVPQEMLALVFEEEEEIERYRIVESKQTNAKQFGTLMTFPESYEDLFVKLTDFIKVESEDLYVQAAKEELKKRALPIVEIAHFLTMKYDVVCTNPPYHNKFNLILKKFMQQNYPDTKSDMYSAFIEKTFRMTKENGYAALMTPYTWMYISSHEKLRKHIINNGSISSLAELEYSAFEDATVPLCTFVLQNQHKNTVGKYVKLTEFKGGMDVQNEKIKEASNNEECDYIFEVEQNNFEKIPGSPIAYWANEKIYTAFSTYPLLSNIAPVKKGLDTGNNSRYLRYWFEISFYKLGIGYGTAKEFTDDNKKWAPHDKGGEFRKWYGNKEWVINWENDGLELKESTANLRSKYLYFKKSITWNSLSSGNSSFRYSDYGAISNTAGSSLYPTEKQYKFLLGILNSKVSQYVLNIISPTLNYSAGYIAALPIAIRTSNSIDYLVDQSINISKEDWNSFETSWDFKQHPFINYKDNTEIIQEAFQSWTDLADKRFNQLKSNEEELNVKIIEIYGLKEEITPEVEDKHIKVSKAELNQDIKSFLSYLVGVIFGRYSLDESGLIYAGGEFNLERYKTYKPDKDNIIPITDEHYFEDDIVTRIIELVKIIFGEQTVEENVQFIAEALGIKSDENSRDAIRRYFMKDFFKDHKKIYQNRPIYWQMTSGKQDAFKGLIYLHRYESTTLARVRTDYVLPLTNTITELMRQAQLVIDGSESSKEVAKAQKTEEKYQKQLQELRDYDLILKNLADQEIELDLDDGVKVNYEKFQNVPVIGTSNQRMTKMNLFEKI